METRDEQPSTPKKPYVAPKLVRLGSVRELTFKSGKQSEAPFGKTGGGGP